MNRVHFNRGNKILRENESQCMKKVQIISAKIASSFYIQGGLWDNEISLWMREYIIFKQIICTWNSLNCTICHHLLHCDILFS